jgi:transitional endoplasmic reticulum ATPase
MMEAGFPARWGVLLAGPFGTGKTMIASVTALKCQRNGITFISVDSPSDLVQMVPIARRYEPCVLFCEDIDRKMPGNKARGAEHDALLNIIDGVKSKDSQLILVLTTNEAENIHPALMRPGRLDAVVAVEPPDAEAVQRLIRVYGGAFVPDTLDLDTIGSRLEGQKTSVVRAVVEKAKSDWIGSNPEVAIRDMELDEDHFHAAVDSMENQMDLLNRKVDAPLPVEVAAASIHAGALDRFAKAIATGEWSDEEPKKVRNLTSLPLFEQ